MSDMATYMFFLQSMGKHEMGAFSCSHMISTWKIERTKVTSKHPDKKPTGTHTDTTYMFFFHLWKKKISASCSNMTPARRRRSAREVGSLCACQGLEIESGRREAIQRSASP